MSSTSENTVLLPALAGCGFLQGCSEKELAQVGKVCRLINLRKGEYLFREGDRSRGAFLVFSGSINLHRSMRDGREQMIKLFKSGDSFAEATLAALECYPATAQAIEITQVALVEKEAFLVLLQKDAGLAMRVMKAMGSHLKHLVTRMEDLNHRSVDARLARWLFQHAVDREGESVVELVVTKKILAAEIGTVSETLSRILGRFRDDGLVRVEGKKITLLNEGALRERLKDGS
jgi:CRP-like cAMP-binding protein